MKQGSGRNRLIYSGLATARHCNSFFPMVPGPGNTPTVRKVYMEMESSEPVPADGDHRFNLKFMYPNIIRTKIYEHPTIRLESGKVVLDTPDYPTTEEDLEERWKEISRQYIFMYPGGAGAKIEQFLMVPDFIEVKERIESAHLPLWFPDRTRGFIPETQGGWVGPVVSYYNREDSNHRSYW